MLELLDMGEKLYPDLYEPFLNSPDKLQLKFPVLQSSEFFGTINAYS
jgi:hypothetical protein